MSRILVINLSAEERAALRQALTDAGRAVGRHESRIASIYLTKESRETSDFRITVGPQPSPFAVLIATVRYRRSLREYRATPSNFLDADEFDLIEGEIYQGLAPGIQEYEIAAAETKRIETLDERLLVRWRSVWGNSAYFADEADATAWALREVGTEEVEWNVIRVTGKECEFADEVMAENEIDAVYRAWVKNGPRAIEEKRLKESTFCAHGKHIHDPCPDCEFEEANA